MELYLYSLICFYGRILIKNRDDFTCVLLLLSIVKLFIRHHNVWVHNGTESLMLMMGLLQQEKCMENCGAAARVTTKDRPFSRTHTHKNRNEITTEIRSDSRI